MAITLYAERDDVRAAFEGTIEDDTKTNARLDFLLRQASAKLARLVPSLDRRMAAGTVDPEVPNGLVVTAVLRVWRNPAGATQQGVGPFQLSFNKAAQTNEIEFPPDEIAALLGDTRVPSTFGVSFPGRERPVDGRTDAGGYPRTRMLPPGV
jgi:hypothetical protein